MSCDLSCDQSPPHVLSRPVVNAGVCNIIVASCALSFIAGVKKDVFGYHQKTQGK